MSLCDNTADLGAASSGPAVRSPGGAGARPGDDTSGPPEAADVKKWTDDIDIATVPDEVLYSEVGRRRGQHRTADNLGGRPPVLRPCKWCREKFGAREMREHIPHCPKRK